MGNRFRQLRLLLWKNFILQIRRPVGTFIEIILPVLVTALLILAKQALDVKKNCFMTFPIQPTEGFAGEAMKEQYRRKANCQNCPVNSINMTKLKVDNSTLQLAYYPINALTTNIISQVGIKLKLRPQSKDSFGKVFKSEDAAAKEASEFFDKFFGAIIFQFDVSTRSLPKDVKYKIRLSHKIPALGSNNARGTWRTDRNYPFFNAPGARTQNYYIGHFLPLQYEIDKVIGKIHFGSKNISMKPVADAIQQFPYPNWTSDPFMSLVQGLMPLLFILAFVYSAVSIVKELVAEKESRLRESMKMMGLANWLHWLAWFLKNFIFLLVSVLLLTAFCKGAKIFQYSHWSIVLLFFLLYAVATILTCFFVSTLFSNAIRSMLFGATLWIGSLAPYLSFSSPEAYEQLSRAAKMATCLLPNSCFGMGIQVISRFEIDTTGAQWSTIGQPANIDDNISLGDIFVMFVVDAIIFWILTWYIEAVFPGDFGIPRPFYFPFLPSYWFNKSGNSISFKDDGSSDEKNPNVEQETTGAEIGVRIENLRKVFKGSTGKKVAVDNLSLNVFKGQITALLGHNGAGKTTTMSILTGLFPPSGGVAFVNGLSIANEMDKIRDSLGLCPQHNVLFDRLTVKEHLVFFSALKGISGKHTLKQVTDMIADLQLVEKTNKQSSTLSGGMKRKLSCAIALIGDPKIVFLDEPTSGMDPYARRATWDLLQKHRQDKTIILTTHFMDEADYLGDRIAIMAEGKLKCCGSSLFLKKRFGAGYHMILVKGPEFKENAVIRAVQEHVPNINVASNVGAEMAFVLDHESSKYFKPLFTKLENEQSELGISSFGVSVTTMEEVFLKVGEGTDQTIDELQEADGKNRESHAIVVESRKQKQGLVTGTALKLTQFKALFLKRFLNSKRDKKAVITQILLPLVCVLFGLLLLDQSPTQNDDRPLTMKLRHLYDVNNPTKAIFADFRNIFNRERMRQFSSEHYAGERLKFLNIRDPALELKLLNQGRSMKTKDNTYTIGSAGTECCNYKFLVLNDVCKKTLKDEKSYKEVCKSSKTFGYDPCQSCIESYMKSGQKAMCPISVNKTDLNDHSTYYSQYVLQQSDAKKYFNIHVAGMSVKEVKGQQHTTSWYSNEGYHNVAEGLSAVNNILLQIGMNDSSYGITTTNHPLPRSASEQVDVAFSNFGNLSLINFVVTGICFIAASFVTFIVTERVSKAKHIQFVSGVDSVSYWAANYVWDLINYSFPALGIFILFAAFQPKGYTGQELGDVFLILILFGLSVLPFVYCLSFLFTSSMIAYSVIALLLMVVSLAMTIAVFVCNIKGLDLEKEAEIMHHVFLLFPTYAMPQALSDVSKNSGTREACTVSERSKLGCKLSNTIWHESSLSWEQPGIGVHCLYMALEAVVYFILTLLIENRFFIKRKEKQETKQAVNVMEDSDVVAEKDRIHQMNQADIRKEAVVIRDLTKVYSGTDAVAVDHLSLGIPKGECFGLLGVNGAGKTTTFGMLTGELAITKGTAYLDGLNIRTHLKEVQQRIGYCPQFDALVERLTGREMLVMFAQLRGIKPKDIDNIVSDVIAKLNLGKWADKLCGTYSGGNKRKLSTGLALVGDPPIIFLDEPTSGMDPASRRFLWNTLTQLLTNDRSIVLTSHSMEECEALCTRLVIMVNGKFKCVGSIQHLKSRFGQGYTLTIKIDVNDNGSAAHNAITEQDTLPGAEINEGFQRAKPVVTLSQPLQQAVPLTTSNINLYESMNKVKDFVARSFSGAMLIEDRLGFLEYRIINPNLSWSFMFGTLEENATMLNIVDYSISQTSLEQVFINFAKEQHSEERQKVKKWCTGCQCF